MYTCGRPNDSPRSTLCSTVCLDFDHVSRDLSDLFGEVLEL